MAYDPAAHIVHPVAPILLLATAPLGQRTQSKEPESQ